MATSTAKRKKSKRETAHSLIFHLSLPGVSTINLQSNRPVMGGKIKATGL